MLFIVLFQCLIKYFIKHSQLVEKFHLANIRILKQKYEFIKLIDIAFQTVYFTSITTKIFSSVVKKSSSE